MSFHIVKSPLNMPILLYHAHYMGAKMDTKKHTLHIFTIINNGRIYYYLMFRKTRKVKQEHIGNRNKVDLNEEKLNLKEYNKRVKLAKYRYKDLKKRNHKMKRVLNFAIKIYNE